MANIAAPRNYGSVEQGAADNELDHIKIAQIEQLHSSNDTKDKTQVASTTSMAVIHIGVLKILLDAGPGNVSYYDWCLGIVIAALALQFISGIIAIYIATMKSFLSQFHGDFTYYCKSSFCPCLKDHRRDVPMDVKTLSTKTRMIETETLVGHSEATETVCCFCCRKPMQPPKQAGELSEYSNYEEMLLDRYNRWIEEHLDRHMDAIQVTQNVASTENQIAKLKITMLSKASNPEDKSEVEREIVEKERDLEPLLQETLSWQAFQKRGAVLRKQLKHVVDDKVMKKATFWQCVLTVLTYMVFALNAVITGFGLANISKK